MNVSRAITASITALVIAGSAGLAFAQSNTSSSPSTPAPVAANQEPPTAGSKPMGTKPRTKTKVQRKTAPRAEGNNTSSSPSTPAPAAANQTPPPVGSTPMTSSTGSVAMPERTPPRTTGSNTSSSPSTPAPAAANQTPPPVGSTPMTK